MRQMKWLSFFLLSLSQGQAESDFLSRESQGNSSGNAREASPQKTPAQAGSKEKPTTLSEPSSGDHKFEKGGTLPKGTAMCGNPQAAAAAHALATGAADQAAVAGNALKSTAGDALGKAKNAAGNALGAAKGALGGLAAAGAAMAAFNAIKKGFCQTGCSAKACANSARIHTMCTSKCPPETIVNCQAARNAKDNAASEYGT